MMNFDCRLAAGRYRFYVYVTDAAGNTQARVARTRWPLISQHRGRTGVSEVV